MEIDIDVYFWVVDRGVFDDDQRNKVEMERNKVKMHREHSQRLENGYYIAKLMTILKKSVMKISRKPFSLDPNLGNMKDNITSTSKQQNWNIICKELKKFGIRVDSEKKAKIIEGRAALICDILARLFEFDNSGGQSRFGGDGISSEINFPGQGGSLERDHSGARQNDSTNISIDGKESLAAGNLHNGLQSAQKRGGMLDPLSPGQKKSKLPQNLSPSPPNLRKLKAQSSAQLVNQSVTSLNDIQEGKDLGDSETTLEFILVSLAQNLGVKPKQAAGLLSNNHKYLIHIAVKGMKGSDYSKIHAWYQNIYGFTKQLTQLIDHEKEHNAMKLTLNILKCGLYSQNVDLVITCARVLSKIGQEINQIGGQLAGFAWDWFTDNTGQNASSSNLPGLQQTMGNAIELDIGGPNANLPNVLNESGLSSCLYAMKKFPSDVITTVAPLIIHFGKNNYTEFFSFQLRRHFVGDQQRTLYIQTLHDIVMSVAGSNMFYDAFINSGALDEILTLAIQMADFDPSGNNTQQERISALSFLGDVWEVKPDRIEENQEIAQAILTVMKRGCRDRMRLLRTTSFEIMFKLLHNFSVNRNQFAPIIYKSLTFLLIEFHPHVEIREQLMREFLSLFQQVQTIPVAILCEPLLKQIAISGGTADFNIFDFEFFGIVANHKRATVSIGLQIVDTMVQQATSQVFYSNSATSIVLELVHRFSREQPMHQHMSKVTADLIALLDESERWKKANQNSFDQYGNNNSLKKVKTTRGQGAQLDAMQTEAQTVSLARKMRERLIVNFLKQMILFGIELVKEDIRTQVLRGYARLEHQAKIKQPKSLHYLLSLYQNDDGTQADVPHMLQYFMEQEKTRSKRNKPSLNLNPSGTNLGQDQLDDFLLETSNNQQLMLAGIAGPDDSYIFGNKRPTKAQVHLERAMKEIEKIKAVKVERTDKKHLEDELKRLKDEQMKVTAKKQVERRQLEHGVLPKLNSDKKLLGGMTRGMSVDQRNMMNGAHNTSMIMDKDGEPLEIKIIKAKEIDDLTEIGAGEDKRLSLLPADELNARNRLLQAQRNTMLKSLKEFQLYDLRNEEQKDQDAVRFFVKKHVKVLRNLFSKYANSTGPINSVHQTFEDLNKQNQIINVAEMMRLLKDFQVNALQVPQKLVMQMFRAINKDLNKRNNTAPLNSQMTTLDFEGFVEFLLQLSVNLYSYDSAMTPAEYLQKLFDNFRTAATKTGSNLLKLFQAAAQEDPLVVSGVLDNKMILELNKRLARDPAYQLPEGYVKVTEREIENKYTIPAYFNIKESKRVAVETLDQIMFNALGIHLLEPMAEVKETIRAKPILKQMTKDKVMSEITTGANKNVLKAINEQPRTIQQKRRTEANKSSNSVDQTPIAKTKNLLNKELKKDDVLEKPSPHPKPKKELPPPPKVELGVVLKIEVGKHPADKRPIALEAAYTIEELLQAVEQNQTNLPRLANPKAFHAKVVKPPPNKLVEDRIKKQEEDVKMKADERKKLEIRKKLLKEQLDELKVQKTKKDADKKKVDDEKKAKKEEIKKRNKDKLKQDMDNLKVEFAEKREKKMAEEAEKKASDPIANMDPAQKAAEVKEKLKERKIAMIEQMHMKAQDRKDKVIQEEAKQQKKEEEKKQKSEQIKQMYADTKEKTKDIKDRYKQEYQTFKESPLIKQVYTQYERAITAFYDKYAKADPTTQGLLTYAEYMKIGKLHALYPNIVTSQDYIYVYKTQMKVKKQTEKEKQMQLVAQKSEQSILDIQGSRLTLAEFKECLLKIACLGKLKLGGTTTSNLPEDIKLAEQTQKQKVKSALQNAAQTGVLKKPKDEGDTGHVNEDLLNVFEKEFDVNDMTQYTVENLFKHLQMKPDLKALQKEGGSAQQSPVNNKAKSKINTGGPNQPPGPTGYNTSSGASPNNGIGGSQQPPVIRQTSNGAGQPGTTNNN